MLLGNAKVEGSINVTPVAQWLGAENPENFFSVFPILYLIVCVLTIVVFNLGFARKLPLLKQAIVYAALLLGNILLTLLAITLPIIESLFIAVLVLSIYKIRLLVHKREEVVEEN